MNNTETYLALIFSEHGHHTDVLENAECAKGYAYCWDSWQLESSFPDFFLAGFLAKSVYVEVVDLMDKAVWGFANKAELFRERVEFSPQVTYTKEQVGAILEPFIQFVEKEDDPDEPVHPVISRLAELEMSFADEIAEIKMLVYNLEKKK